MVAKAVLLFCAQALLAQCISGQCLRSGYNGIINEAYAAPWNAPYVAEAPWAAGPYAVAPCAERIDFRPSNGGGFPITSVSPISVTGITMTSENAYEGAVAVSGTVPFLGAVALEGGLPTAGVGAVSYGCGNGEVGMLSERINGYGAFAGPYGYGAPEAGYGYGPLGYEAGIAGPGYGYNRGCGCGGPFY